MSILQYAVCLWDAPSQWSLDSNILNCLIMWAASPQDHLHDDSLRNFIKVCNNYELNNVFYEVPGVGHDDYCWDKALYAFMKYAFK